MNNAQHELLPGSSKRGIAPPVHTAAATIPSGFAELDQALPGGGWPKSALTELLQDQNGNVALQLILPALARLSRSGRWIALVAPPRFPGAAALAAQGIDPSRILLVHPRQTPDLCHSNLQATERALSSGTCAAVLCWPENADENHLQRLQWAAKAGKTWGVLIHREHTPHALSPASLQIRLQQDTQGTLLSLFNSPGSLQGHQLRLDLERPRVRAMPVQTPQSAKKADASPRRITQLGLPLERRDPGHQEYSRLRVLPQSD